MHAACGNSGTSNSLFAIRSTVGRCPCAGRIARPTRAHCEAPAAGPRPLSALLRWAQEWSDYGSREAASGSPQAVTRLSPRAHSERRSQLHRGCRRPAAPPPRLPDSYGSEVYSRVARSGRPRTSAPLRRGGPQVRVDVRAVLGGAPALLVVQMAGVHGVGQAGLITLCRWAVGLSLIGLRTGVLPRALCVLGILRQNAWSGSPMVRGSPARQ